MKNSAISPNPESGHLYQPFSLSLSLSLSLFFRSLSDASPRLADAYGLCSNRSLRPADGEAEVTCISGSPTLISVSERALEDAELRALQAIAARD